MTFLYSPAASGGWFALIDGDRALLLGDAAHHDDIEAAWSRRAEGAAAIIELVTARGLRETPPFVVVEPTDDGYRAIVRGPTTVTIGAETVSGAGAATWIERVVPAGPIAIEVSELVPVAPELPITSGVVRAAVIRSSDSARTAASPSAAPSAAVAAADSVSSVTTAVAEETVVTALTSTPDPEPVPAAPSSAPSGTPSGTTEGDYDFLFGDTMYRSVGDAAVREEEPAEDPGDAGVRDGDHDGATMLVSTLGRRRGGGRGRAKTASEPPPAPASIAIVLPGNVREVVDEPIVLGRAPSVSGVPAGQVPRLVTLGGDKDISRNHVRFALEGDTVVVTDLHSKNGTTIALPGKEAHKLRAGEPTPVIVGTVVDLGGGVALTVEQL